MKKTLIFIFYLVILLNSIFAINLNFLSKFNKNDNTRIKFSKEDTTIFGEIEFFKHNQILKLNDDKQKINIHLKPFSFT